MGLCCANAHHHAPVKDRWHGARAIQQLFRSTGKGVPVAVLTYGEVCVALWHALSGDCAPEVDFFEMSAEQKLAYVRICKAELECQAHRFSKC